MSSNIVIRVEARLVSAYDWPLSIPFWSPCMAAAFCVDLLRLHGNQEGGETSLISDPETSQDDTPIFPGDGSSRVM